MSDSDLQIAIRVDASAARQGADEAKAAIGGIGPQIEALGKTFGELGKSLKGGLEGLGQIGKAIAGVGKEGGSLRVQAVAGGKGPGALFRRLELGSKTRRRAGAAVKNACQRASSS